MWSSDIYKILNRNIVQKSSKYLNHISSEYLDCEHVYRISLIWYLSVLDNFLCHPHCLPNLVHNLITRTIKQFMNHQLWSGVWPYSRFGNFVSIFSTNEIWTFAATFSPPLQFVWYELVVNASDEETTRNGLMFHPRHKSKSRRKFTSSQTIFKGWIRNWLRENDKTFRGTEWKLKEDLSQTFYKFESSAISKAGWCCCSRNS